MKKCTKCCVIKKLSDFGTRKGRAKSWCKKCECMNAAERRKENLEEVRKRGRELYAADIEESRRKGRQKYHRNVKAGHRYLRKWRKMHPKKVENQRARATAKRRLRAYGITQEEFSYLLTEQNGRCIICSVILNNKVRNAAPCVDHDHATGKIRGVLCRQCNVGLGNFKDSAQVAEAAADYLRRHT